MSYVSPIKIGYDAEPEEGWTDKIGKYIAGEVDNLVLQSCVKVGCHVDKDELEKALRYDRDQYVKGYEDGKRDAAAAIEALEARLGEAENSVERWKDMYLTKHEPKRGEWIVREVDSPGEMHPVAFRCMCSICRNEYLFPRIPRYCPDCGSMNTAKMEVQE